MSIGAYTWTYIINQDHTFIIQSSKSWLRSGLPLCIVTGMFLNMSRLTLYDTRYDKVSVISISLCLSNLVIVFISWMQLKFFLFSTCSVKPAVFDLFLAGAIASYVGVVYLFLQVINTFDIQHLLTNATLSYKPYWYINSKWLK